MKYQIIYADPPWRYRHGTAGTRSIEKHYPTMQLNDIKSLNVPSDKDSILFLWTTSPKIKESLEVLTSWGFDYRSSFVWDKQIMGLGYWTRIQHELILVGIKGKPKTPPQSLRIRSIFSIKRTRHSEKPEFFREMINKWYPDYKKLELFARKNNAGWDCYGNEIENSILIPLPQ